MIKNNSLYKTGWCGIWIFCFILSYTGLHAQVLDTVCNPYGSTDFITDAQVFNGGITNMANNFNRTDAVIGQPVASQFHPQNNAYLSGNGFFARYLMPPAAPLVRATQGDYPDRVQIKWEIDRLSPPVEEFRLYRDGNYLGKFDNDVFEYIDFNAQAGEVYSYSVVSFDSNGLASLAGEQTGFVNPNGVISGRITTRNGNPVLDCTITVSPTFGQSMAFDGISDNLCASYHPSLPTDAFTFSTWVKVDAYNGGAIIDLGSTENQNWWLKTENGNTNLKFGIGEGSTSIESTLDMSNDPNSWHHIAAVYNGASVTMYLDGEYRGAINAVMDTLKTRFPIGCNFDQTAYYEGKIDDTRIYNKTLSQTEIILSKDISASSFTPGLVAYWKFDEGKGSTAFDISSHEIDAYIYSGNYSSDAPDILNGGMTDANGYYIIEGIDYSQNSNMTVTPMKSFYKNFSLEFQAANEAYAELAAFDIPDTSTIEIVCLPFDTQSKQVILTNGEGAGANFQFYIENNTYKLTINNQTVNIGAPTGQYEHFAITINPSVTNKVSVYRNGALLGDTYGFGSVGGDWSTNKWLVGAENETTPTNFYTGLVDKVSIYNKDFVQSNVQILASTNPNPSQAFIDSDSTRNYIYVDYGFNESKGNELDDFGPKRFHKDVMEDYVSFHYNATYSIVARVQDESPHEFEPNSKNVVLNYSSTSVSNVDFTDISTVSISGVVRYEDTFCYGDSLIEILVDGESAFPPIFLNNDGVFVADFEPGSNVKLSPTFEDHEFNPPFFEVRNLNTPIANILFTDKTKREVEGQLFGGHCKKSIITTDINGDPIGITKVKIASLNGCYEEVIEIDNGNGDFIFKNVPPVPVSVAVIDYPVQTILDAFQVQGGIEINLRAIERDTVEFKYTSSPIVEIGEISDILTYECSGLNDPSTPVVWETHHFPPTVIPAAETASGKDSFILKEYYNDIRVYEQYIGSDDGICYLDSFELIIDNALQESPQQVILSDTNTYSYNYHINNPNLLSPYTKNLNVTAVVNGASASATYTAVVLGQRQKDATFSTQAPSEVFCILHDPPGDGSSATWAKGTGRCESWESASIHSEDLSISNEFEFGKKITTFTGVGAGTIQEIEFTNKTTVGANFSASQSNGSTGEFCWETLQEISTSDGDDIFGQYGDVYFGAALNFEIGERDVLEYDVDGCAFTDTVVLSISPQDTFATEFVYSEWQILTDVIPALEAAYATTGNEQDSLDAVRWREIIDENHGRTFDPNKPISNITFDAGVSYTQSRTSTTENSYTRSLTFQAGGNVSTEFGATVFGIGGTKTIDISYSHDWENSDTDTYSSETTTEFTLEDDDLNDFYSIDIGVDPKYSTPMFNLVGGESMCPWIPGTRNREEVYLAVENPIAINVPSNTPAVFHLTLGNIGPNGDDGLVYELGVDEGGNPDGAIIKVDGSPLINPIEFQFIGTSSYTKTLTVEYPNTGQYSFEDLGIYFASVCQIEHSESVGYDAGDGGFLIYDDFADPRNGGTGEHYYSRFYKDIALDVHFVEPCSPIDISSPNQNDVITPGNETVFITLVEYVNTDPDLELVRVQYRPFSGDGAWINIQELPVSDFANDPVFKVVSWDMSDLKDGFYEVRALTQCFDVSLAPGMSEFILIKKETEAPELFGTPEPADGILTTGDEISITFNELINCNKVFPADGIGTNLNLNNIALINTETGALVPFSHQCVGDKIVITPEVQAQFIDGKVLKAVATNVEDLAGNAMSVPVGAPGSPEVNYKEWEFLVDLNPLRWEDGSNISEVKTEGLIKVVTRNIINNSGTSMNYTITGKRIDNLDGSVSYENIPSWMLVDPKVGTLDAGEIKTITFVFPQDLLVDDYLTEINVVGSQGDNDITVDLKVRCPGPDWDFDRINDFENTMTFTVQVDVFGEITIDNSDRVAAFINGELRGSAYIEKVEAFDGLDNNGDGITDENDIDGAYMAFLTVYGDETDDPIIDFNFFDGSECIVYSQVIEEIPYEPTAQEGTPTNPTVLHLLDVVDRKIPLAQGWTWISVNLDLTDNSTNNVLNLLDNKDNDLIKDDNTFAQYVSGTWVGSMNDIGFEKRYMYFTPEQDTLCLTGMPYDPTTSTIPITSGWNWIGFVPQQGMTVDNALASLTPLNGDLVKSQIAFAQYISGFGWIGNLNVMQAPNGYLLNISNAGTLEYDPTLQARDVHVLEKREPTTPYWDVNSSLYQHNMNVTAIINPEDYQLEEHDQVGVFANGELRGYGEAIYVEPLKEHFLFITAYGDEVTEDLDFVLFSKRDSSLTNLNEIISFTPDRIVGTALEPFVFNIGGATAIDELDTALDVSIYPNPSRYEFNIEFNSPTSEQVNIQLLNVQGQVIETLDVDIPVGQHVLQYNARTLPSGVYNMTISGKDIQVQKKLIKIN